MRLRHSLGTRVGVWSVLAGSILVWHHESAAATYVRLQKAPASTYFQLARGDTDALESLGIMLLDDYGPFAIGLAKDGVDLSAAGSSVGLNISPEPDAYRVDGGGTIIDIRNPEKAIANVPADLLVDDYPAGIGLYLVKFRGPIRPGWFEPLAAAGVRVIQYVHKDAYIVAAAGGLSSLRNLVSGPIIYAGVYHPYFKLAPSLRTSAALTASAKVLIRATLDPEQDLQGVLSQLTSLDATSEIHIDRAKGTAGATLSASPTSWRNLARSPAVIALEPWTGGGVSDERVNQVIAIRRNADGTPDTNKAKNYKSWLAGLCIYNGSSLCGDLSTQLVDVMDSGIAANDSGTGAYHADLPLSRIPSSRLYFGIGVLDDTYWHGTVVSGLLAGDPDPAVGGTGQADTQGFYYDMGVAPTVRLHPSRVIGSNGQFGAAVTATLLDTIVANAYTDGARFQNSSWYEDATAYGYTSVAREYDRLVRSARLNSTPDEQITVVVAAGNNFGRTDPVLEVYSPATAKNVISVGASAIQRGSGYGGTLGGSCDTTHTIWDLAEFSRQGVANNSNRFKPDIYAPGQNITSARTQSISGQSVCGGSKDLTLPTGGSNYPANGTSFSAPIVTGAAVLARQKIYADTADPQCGQAGKPACPNPSPALIKAVLLGTTETNSLGGYNYYMGFSNGWEPSRYQGFGRLALAGFLEYPESKAYVDEDHAGTPTRRFLQAGSYQNFTFTVADPSKAISAVLVYSDAPGAVNANVPRVNDVDMYVMQGGAVYCDGQYGGQYATRSSSCWLPDLENNVKRVRIAPNSFTGQFTIQMVAGAVSANAVLGRDNNAPNQDWALYVYNAIQNF